MQLDHARACIQRAFEMEPNLYISMSFGKDSSAMAALVLEIAPTTPIRVATCWETRLVHQNFDSCLDWWRQNYPLSTITEIPYRPTRGLILGPKDLNVPEGRMVEILNEGSPHRGAYIGLRAMESGNRAMSLHHHRDEPRYAIYRYRSGLQIGTLRVCPLERWNVKDVGALLAEREIPILDTYDMEGLDARTTLRLCPESIRGGVLDNLRRRAPHAYRELLLEHPELGMIGG